MPSQIDSGSVVYAKKLFTAILFIGSTIQLVFVSHAIITLRYFYPPYQTFGLSQLIILVVVLWVGRCFNLVELPGLNRRVASRIAPLLLLNCGCVATSLEYYDVTGISVFNISYRLVLLTTVTMVLERVILNIEMNTSVKFTIATMVAGAIICGPDVDVSVVGHFVILLNYIFLAATRVYFKMILDSRELGVCGLIYYSTIILLIPPLVVAYSVDMLFDDFSIYWGNLQFWCSLLLTSIMGAILTWSAIMCIQYNGALTTTIIGSLTNTFITVITYIESEKESDDALSKFSWHYYVGSGFVLLASFVYLVIIFNPNSYSDGVLVSKDEDTVGV